MKKYILDTSKFQIKSNFWDITLKSNQIQIKLFNFKFELKSNQINLIWFEIWFEFHPFKWFEQAYHPHPQKISTFKGSSYDLSLDEWTNIFGFIIFCLVTPNRNHYGFTNGNIIGFGFRLFFYWRPPIISLMGSLNPNRLSYGFSVNKYRLPIATS